VPNTRVRWRHAFTAGLMAALGIEMGKKLLTGYLAQMPTYSAIYGAFAAVPILLVWVYVAWLVVLLGAVVASSLPELGRHHLRRPAGAGWPFRLSLEVLAQLSAVRSQTARGLTQNALAQRMRVQSSELDVVLRGLLDLDWIGSLQEEGGAEPRLVLLVEPDQTLVKPLAERWLLRHAESSDAFWSATRMDQLRLAEVLPEA
jgi:membrane protein